MDDALSWFRAFLDTEWTAKTAYHLEPDADTFHAARAAYNALKEDDVGDYLNRSGTPEDLAKLKEMYATRGERVLFAARPVVVADGEPGWAFYTSGFILVPTGRAIAGLFVVQQVEGSYRVQAEYEECMDCDGTGEDDGDTCEECSGAGFMYCDGVDLGMLTSAGPATKCEAPTHPRSLPAYEAL